MISVRERIYRLISWSPLLFLGGLAVLTYWLNTQIQSPDTFGDKEKAHTQDLFIKNFRAVIFDENGFPKQQLAADYAEHFVDDESIILARPQLMITHPERPRLTMRAEQGKVSGDHKNVYLERDVVVMRAADKSGGGGGFFSNEPLTMRTESLHLLPEDEKMQTNQQVEISSPSGKIESTGMDLNDKTKTIKLHTNVKGYFEPRK
ncbi:MAG: LPS export ABC transporter periplasmic protein LptC [Burkholderiales bacterium]|jgi:lipopolysaccharide export system protein LptC|nr:LPS export ABC transporter periplasmic protein LptC [Burkholderiales bacterium]